MEVEQKVLKEGETRLRLLGNAESDLWERIMKRWNLMANAREEKEVLS
jgi:hypothetical protein